PAGPQSADHRHDGGRLLGGCAEMPGLWHERPCGQAAGSAGTGAAAAEIPRRGRLTPASINNIAPARGSRAGADLCLLWTVGRGIPADFAALAHPFSRNRLWLRWAWVPMLLYYSRRSDE